MDIVCHENPYVDSVFHVPAERYNQGQIFQFIGAPSIHEHIILNDGCALITFSIGGKDYEYDGNLICGKFTDIPRIKIVFKNTDKKLTVIRLAPYGMFKLTQTPVESMVNRVLSGSDIGIDAVTEKESGEYICRIDALMTASNEQKAYCLTREIVSYVNANFAQLPTNVTQAVAQRFGISERSLRRYFKEYLGISLSTYFMTVKRKKMIQTIYEDNYDSLSVRESGYYDQSHFLNDFKRLYGIPLKQYLHDMQAMKKRSPELMKFLYHCNIQSEI